MHPSRDRSFVQIIARTAARAAALLAASSLTAATLVAQVTEANYPLAIDLQDATQNYGPMTLMGNNPPAPPNNGVCVDGVYLNNGGQDARTPNITGLDSTDFQIEIEFQVAALQPFRMPILVGGNGWRWIGFQVDSGGEFGLLYNNANSDWSTSTVTIGTWHSGVIKHEAGMTELWLDGSLVLTTNTGTLDIGPNDLDFTTNNFSNGTAFEGCIRNIEFANDTTLGGGPSSIGTNYCSPGNPNSTGVPGVIEAFGSDLTTQNNVTLTGSSLPANSFAFFLTSQTQGLTQNPGGSDGNLCLGGMIGRYVGPGQIQNTGGMGTVSLSLDLTMTPTPTGLVAVQAGESWNFQAWHRDASGGVATSNFTDGLEIVFQ